MHCDPTVILPSASVIPCAQVTTTRPDGSLPYPGGVGDDCLLIDSRLQLAHHGCDRSDTLGDILSHPVNVSLLMGFLLMDIFLGGGGQQKVNIVPNRLPMYFLHTYFP